MPKRMQRSQLVAELRKRRDNDVTVAVGDSFVPVTGVRYEPALDLIVIDLDADELAFATADGGSEDA